MRGMIHAVTVREPTLGVRDSKGRTGSGTPVDTVVTRGYVALQSNNERDSADQDQSQVFVWVRVPLGTAVEKDSHIIVSGVEGHLDGTYEVISIRILRTDIRCLCRRWEF